MSHWTVAQAVYDYEAMTDRNCTKGLKILPLFFFRGNKRRKKQKEWNEEEVEEVRGKVRR